MKAPSCRRWTALVSSPICANCVSRARIRFTYYPHRLDRAIRLPSICHNGARQPFSPDRPAVIILKHLAVAKRAERHESNLGSRSSSSGPFCLARSTCTLVCRPALSIRWRGANSLHVPVLSMPRVASSKSKTDALVHLLTSVQQLKRREKAFAKLKDTLLVSDSAAPRRFSQYQLVVLCCERLTLRWCCSLDQSPRW